MADIVSEPSEHSRDVTLRLAAMEQQITSVAASVDRIESTLALICDRLEATQTSCANMDEHIGFVESVYSAVRQPLSYIVCRMRSEPLPTFRRLRTSPVCISSNNTR